jgi:hypothetical protein
MPFQPAFFGQCREVAERAGVATLASGGKVQGVSHRLSVVTVRRLGLKSEYQSATVAAAGSTSRSFREAFVSVS